MADSNSFRLGVLGSGKGSSFVAVAEARARGTMRLEGKTYEVQDGDITHFRHSR